MGIFTDINIFGEFDSLKQDMTKKSKKTQDNTLTKEQKVEKPASSSTRVVLKESRIPKTIKSSEDFPQQIKNVNKDSKLPEKEKKVFSTTSEGSRIPVKRKITEEELTKENAKRQKLDDNVPHRNEKKVSSSKYHKVDNVNKCEQPATKVQGKRSEKEERTLKSSNKNSTSSKRSEKSSSKHDKPAVKDEKSSKKDEKSSRSSSKTEKTSESRQKFSQNDSQTKPKQSQNIKKDQNNNSTENIANRNNVKNEEIILQKPAQPASQGKPEVLQTVQKMEAPQQKPEQMKAIVQQERYQTPQVTANKQQVIPVNHLQSAAQSSSSQVQKSQPKATESFPKEIVIAQKSNIICKFGIDDSKFSLNLSEDEDDAEIAEQQIQITQAAPKKIEIEVPQPVKEESLAPKPANLNLTILELELSDDDDEELEVEKETEKTMEVEPVPEVIKTPVLNPDNCIKMVNPFTQQIVLFPHAQKINEDRNYQQEMQSREILRPLHGAFVPTSYEFVSLRDHLIPVRVDANKPLEIFKAPHEFFNQNRQNPRRRSDTFTEVKSIQPQPVDNRHSLGNISRNQKMRQAIDQARETVMISQKPAQNIQKPAQNSQNQRRNSWGNAQNIKKNYQNSFVAQATTSNADPLSYIPKPKPIAPAAPRRINPVRPEMLKMYANPATIKNNTVSELKVATNTPTAAAQNTNNFQTPQQPAAVHQFKASQSASAERLKDVLKKLESKKKEPKVVKSKGLNLSSIRSSIKRCNQSKLPLPKNQKLMEKIGEFYNVPEPVQPIKELPVPQVQPPVKSQTEHPMAKLHRISRAARPVPQLPAIVPQKQVQSVQKSQSEAINVFYKVPESVQPIQVLPAADKSWCVIENNFMISPPESHHNQKPSLKMKLKKVSLDNVSKIINNYGPNVENDKMDIDQCRRSSLV